ncbi:hypothetical protein GW17_00028004 [Ensete ventricosum]|uniref:Uncharacterized protein n=1 Tax=Ensete ventricosum TaxID=4639 RepID=A0A444EDT4_ENSVE|nr:hypothetical protein GW17_00028004 [Ensete ventricosum]RZR70910.1 hypothetical protein BHM03_00002153 [Ensete ventricosum]
MVWCLVSSENEVTLRSPARGEEATSHSPALLPLENEVSPRPARGDEASPYPARGDEASPHPASPRLERGRRRRLIPRRLIPLRLIPRGKTRRCLIPLASSRTRRRGVASSLCGETLVSTVPPSSGRSAYRYPVGPAPYRPIHTNLAADRFADRPLPGGTAKIGRRQLILAVGDRFRLSAVNFDRRRSIDREIDRRWLIEEEKGKRKKKYLATVLACVLPTRPRLRAAHAPSPPAVRQRAVVALAGRPCTLAARG